MSIVFHGKDYWHIGYPAFFISHRSEQAGGASGGSGLTRPTSMFPEVEGHVVEAYAELILNLSGEMIGGRARQLGECLHKFRECDVDNVILNFAEVSSIDSLAVSEISSAVESGLNIGIILPNTDCVEFLRKSRCQAEIYQNEADARRRIRDAKALSLRRKEQNWTETDLPATFVAHGKSIPGTLLKVTRGVAFLALNDPLSPKDLSGKITVAVKSKKFGKLNLAGTVEWTRKTGNIYNVGVKILQ